MSNPGKWLLSIIAATSLFIGSWAAVDTLVEAQSVESRQRVYVLPDHDSTLLTFYAEAGSEVDLHIPIRYCYDRARITKVIRHEFDQMSKPGTPAQPSDNQAKLDLQTSVTHEGRAIRARFTMPDSPASLQIYYHAPWGSPRWGPHAGERARHVDVHLVPEPVDFPQWLKSF